MKWWDWMPWSYCFESFKPAVLLSSLTLIKKFFSLSSLSAIRVVSSACLRLLMFLPAILIPACQSSSLAFHMMYSAYTEKAMATHSSTLVWRIPWMEEPGRLQSMGLLRVGHDWVTFTFHFHALEKEMATHSCVLAWRIPGTAEPVGCRLWDRTESDTTEATWQQQYSVYKLNKQGDNIQPWCTPFPILNLSVVPCLVLTVASWPAYRFLRRQVRWSGIPISLRIFHCSTT